MDEQAMVCSRCFCSQREGWTGYKCTDQRCYFYAGSGGLRTNGLSSSPSSWCDRTHMTLDSLQKNKDVWTCGPKRLHDPISFTQGRPRVASSSDVAVPNSLKQKHVGAAFRSRLLSLPGSHDPSCAMVEDKTLNFLPCTAFSAPLVPEDAKQVC